MTTDTAQATDTPKAEGADDTSVLDPGNKSDDTSQDTSTTKGEDTGKKQDAAPKKEPEKKEDVKQDEKPVEYKLELPKDSPLQQDAIEAVVEFAKEHKLTPEAAQKMLERNSAQHAAILEGQREFLSQQVTAWKSALVKDVEIAGKNGEEYSNNVTLAKQAIARFASPELLQQLNKTGLGNHPELVRTFVRIGRAMREDKFHSGRGDRGTAKDLESKFYSSSTSKE